MTSRTSIFLFRIGASQTRHRVHVRYTLLTVRPRGIDPYGTGGGMSPNIYEGGTSMVMSPQYFRSDVVYDIDSSDSNCCLLYFNANIMCSFTKKASASGGLRPQDPLPRLRPGPHWGTLSPRLPTGPTRLCPWTPLGFSDPQSSFMSPNNPVRSMPLFVFIFVFFCLFRRPV